MVGLNPYEKYALLISPVLFAYSVLLFPISLRRARTISPSKLPEQSITQIRRLRWEQNFCLVLFLSATPMTIIWMSSKPSFPEYSNLALWAGVTLFLAAAFTHLQTVETTFKTKIILVLGGLWSLTGCLWSMRIQDLELKSSTALLATVPLALLIATCWFHLFMRNVIAENTSKKAPE